MTRHGLKKVESDIVKRATFEEVVGVFIQAAIHERQDPVSSVSACILTGKTAHIGTNAVHVVEQKEEPLFDDWNADWVAQEKPDWLSNVSNVSNVPSPDYAPMSPDYAPD
jgi:hypothetical protein